MSDPTCPAAPPFADLTPDAVLNAIDSLGMVTSGTLLALNSYENRVFQVGVEDSAQRFVIAKFYRPARWSDAQILEEHVFTQELADAEVPAAPPARDRRRHAARAGRLSLRALPAPRRPRPRESRTATCASGSAASSVASMPLGAPRRTRTSARSTLETFGEEPRAYALLIYFGILIVIWEGLYTGLATGYYGYSLRCLAHIGSAPTRPPR